MRRELSGLVAVVSMLVLAACGSAATGVGEDVVGLEPPSEVSSASTTDVGGRPPPGGDDADTVSTGASLADSEDRSPRAVRTDPVPVGATIEQTEDVVRSMLGPTEDFTTQGLRIDPVFPSLPTPPDSEIVRLRFSGTAEFGDGPTVSRTSMTVHTSTDYEDVTALFLDTIANDHPDWEEIQGRSVAAGMNLGFDLPQLESLGSLDERIIDPELNLSFTSLAGGGAEVKVSVSVIVDDPETLWAPMAGWEDEFPLPADAERISLRVEASLLEAPVRGLPGVNEILFYAAHWSRSGKSWIESVPEVEALLGAAGLTPDQELAEIGQGDVLVLSGTSVFDQLTMKACCPDNEYITGGFNLRYSGIRSLGE